MVARALFRMAALFLAYGLATTRGIYLPDMDALLRVLPYAMIFAAIGFVFDQAFRLNRTPWRYASVRDVLVIVRNATFVILTFLLAIFAFDRALFLPRSTVFLTWGIDIGLITGFLVFYRAVRERTLTAALAPFLVKATGSQGAKLLLVGALDRADAYLRESTRNPDPAHYPIGLVTGIPSDVGKDLHGIRVLASIQGIEPALERFASSGGDRAILFLDGSVAPADIDPEQLGRLRGQGVRFLRLSRLIELAEGGVRPELHEIKVEDLLSRPPVQLDIAQIRNLVSGRRVLVTGAGGSIGSEICRQVAALGCAHLGLLDNSEFALFNIDMEIADRYPTLSRREILCDVRDAERVMSWVGGEQPDVIFHAAALKHVPLMENHPCESVLTNVVGTWNMGAAAHAHEIEHMVFISTDKAVDPGNVMGATKRLAESTLRAHQAVSDKTRFSIVRFGNVLGSAGSVVPTFKAQIERGGPVTVTHPDVERYFMTIPEAVQLVLHATARSARRENKVSGVFVLDMGQPVKIMDLARRLIELYGKVPGQDIEIQITGLRPGEKLTEELVDSTEEARPEDLGVIEVYDRVQATAMDGAKIARLETMARGGNPDLTRRLIFEYLDLVRLAPSADRLALLTSINGRVG